MRTGCKIEMIKHEIKVMWAHTNIANTTLQWSESI